MKQSSQQLKLALLGTILLVVGSTFQCGGNRNAISFAEASRIFARDAEYQQQLGQLMPQTDPELDLAALKQQQQQFGILMKKLTDNEPDGVLLRHQQQQSHPLALQYAAPRAAARYQRSVSYNQQQQQQQQGAQHPLQQVFEDEHALRRQLPDLIAQAQSDKNIERALLRMLINASLRSNLNSVAGSQSSYSGAYNGARPAGASLDGTAPAAAAATTATTITNDGTGSTNLAAYESQFANNFNAPMARMAFGRFDQALLDAGNSATSNGINPLIAGGATFNNNDMLVESYAGQQELSPVVDKREYIKPCSFNAVSCAKNPFRRF